MTESETAKKKIIEKENNDPLRQRIARLAQQIDAQKARPLKKRDRGCFSGLFSIFNKKPAQKTQNNPASQISHQPNNK